MTKVRTTLTIEDEIYEKAKKNIPNLSEFLEECLKHYFGYVNGTFPIGDVDEISDKIGKLQVELFLINENYDVEESKREAENFEKDKAWRFLWNDYRVKLIADQMLLAAAVKELGINEDTLEDILDEVYEGMNGSHNFIDTDSWDAVYEWYKKVIE